MAWHRLGQFKIGPQNIHELHVGNVYLDPDFDKELKETDKSEWPRLAEKYAITLEDVRWYYSGNNRRSGDFYRKKRKPFRAVNRTDDTIILEFDLDITKEDYLEAWNQWVVREKESHNEGKTPKPKLPAHDKLLYAIFKAREQRGETFKQIFEKYEAGKLPYYDGSNKMFSNDQDKFEEYYRKYKPTP